MTERCGYLSPTYYRGTYGQVQCTEPDGHYPDTNHNISEEDFFASVGLPSREESQQSQSDADAIQLITGFL